MKTFVQRWWRVPKVARIVVYMVIAGGSGFVANVVSHHNHSHATLIEQLYFPFIFIFIAILNIFEIHHDKVSRRIR